MDGKWSPTRVFSKGSWKIDNFNIKKPQIIQISENSVSSLAILVQPMRPLYLQTQHNKQQFSACSRPWQWSCFSDLKGTKLRGHTGTCTSWNMAPLVAVQWKSLRTHLVGPVFPDEERERGLSWSALPSEMLSQSKVLWNFAGYSLKSNQNKVKFKTLQIFYS